MGCSKDQGEGEGCFTREILDVWSRFAEDSLFDNQKLWDRMNECVSKKCTDEVNLWNVSDNFWKGILEMGIAEGLPGDPWPGVTNASGKPYIEYNPTPLISPEYVNDFPRLPEGTNNITVVEPCNTVSNIAYIWTMLYLCQYEYEKSNEWSLAPEFVDGLIQAYNILWIGSAFYHASNSEVGRELDVEGIRIMALLMHQGSLQAIPYDPVIHDIQRTPASFTGQELAIEASRIVSNDPASDWLTNIMGLGSKDYETTFPALVITGLTLVFPPSIVESVGGVLGELLLSGVELDFILDEYAPTLRQAIEDANVNVDFKTKLGLFFKFLGIGIKMIYAFLWQEETIDFVPYNPVTNILGAVSIPRINKFANKLTHYDRFNDVFVQNAVQVYPGDRQCRKQEPHSKWHEQSANGLVDFALISNEVAELIGKGKSIPFDLKTNLIQCHRESDCIYNFDWSKMSSQTSLVFQSCVSELRGEDGGFQLDTSKFIGCMFVSLVRFGNSSASTKEGGDLSPPTLDQCLVENDCIAFNGVELDVGLLRKCIGVGSLFGPRPHCGSPVLKHIPMSLCLMSCGEDSLCSVGCLQRHAELSPWIDKSLSCLTAFHKSGSTRDEKQLRACTQEPIPGSMSEFQTEVVHGLSSLTLCSVHSCDDARKEFTHGFGEVNRCTKACTTSPSQNGGSAFPPAMPKGVACALECTISNVEV